MCAALALLGVDRDEGWGVLQIGRREELCFCRLWLSLIDALARPHPGHVLVEISNQQVCSN
jgi:hypothetical protein